mmetsp:Transcript_14929/g.39958  ORF Transcript_14929/g.39958 Transcript_14929/m.39958 type:complete len:274 (-) Transcript_14929:156-977(-)
MVVPNWAAEFTPALLLLALRWAVWQRGGDMPMAARWLANSLVLNASFSSQPEKSSSSSTADSWLAMLWRIWWLCWRSKPGSSGGGGGALPKLGLQKGSSALSSSSAESWSARPAPVRRFWPPAACSRKPVGMSRSAVGSSSHAGSSGALVGSPSKPSRTPARSSSFRPSRSRRGPKPPEAGGCGSAGGRKADGIAGSIDFCIATEAGCSAGAGSGVDSIAGDGSIDDASDGPADGVCGGESLAIERPAGVCGVDIGVGKAADAVPVGSSRDDA